MTKPRGIDAVLDEFDTVLLAGQFDKAKEKIIAFSQEDHNLDVLLSVLTLTYVWREQLGEARVALAEKARTTAFDLGGIAKVQGIGF